MVLQRIVKAKTQRGKRALRHREPKLNENTKTSMFIKGGNTSNTVTVALKEFYMIKKPHAVMYKKKNIFRPFEDQTQIEFFSERADASLFLFGSHSKKRPHNLTLGRLFDHHILDMFELGINEFKSMGDFPGDKFATGIKPCMIFTGEAFDNDNEFKRLKNLLLDFFRGPIVEKLRLAGLEHVIHISAIDDKVYMRNYRIQLKKSGTRIPRVELEEIGPSADFVVRRTKLASDDLYKRATRVPKAAKVKTAKNISRDPFGSKLGRIHMQKQDLNKLQTRKMKGLKRKGAKSALSDDSAKKSKPEVEN